MAATSTPSTLATPADRSPFALDDERAWRDWRAAKLAGYPRAPRPGVEVPIRGR
jgi:hypothetical protein